MGLFPKLFKQMDRKSIRNKRFLVVSQGCLLCKFSISQAVIYLDVYLSLPPLVGHLK